jgi:hypothetical protein
MTTLNKLRQEYGGLALILLIAALTASVLYYVALSKERNQHKRELSLISQIQGSKEKPEDLVSSIEGEVQRMHEDQYWIGILHHVSTALIISFVIILAVELHTRRLSRKDFDEHMEAVKQNVWNALGKRLLGNLIATELEAIMKETASKENCVYVLTFQKPPAGVRADRILVTIECSYSLRRLSDMRDKLSKFPFTCNISGSDKDGVYPRYTRFKNGPSDEKEPAGDHDNPAILKREIQLPATSEGRVEVMLGMELLYQFRDSESFITEVPIEGLSVFLVNLVPDIISEPTVVMLHRCDELKHPTAQTWTFEKALLPGQGFAVSWNPAPALLPAGSNIGVGTTTAPILGT